MIRNIYLIPIFIFILQSAINAQDRVPLNKQDLWLNGGNVAWVNFARDVGPGTTPLDDFEAMFQQVSENGGNTMRFWVHITGGTTPAWNGNEVTGPGEETIEDLEILLGMAESYGVSLILCLWSFDMLRSSNGTTITDRAKAMLEDSTLTKTYIDNALIPMVESLGDHPALLAWEIFNEPEGMSDEFGWDFTRHTAMSNIQRFVNMTAGAIHRTHPEALVSNGAWSFHSLSNTSNSNSKNYYSDEELINAGKDSLGTLDFYMVHYYEWAGTTLSPFHNDYSTWGLDKPLVVGEFGVPADDLFGIPQEDLYETLYERGYAGALAWQWVDWYKNRGEYGPGWLRALDQMKYMSETYPSDINLVFTNPRIQSFNASLYEIESGGQTELSWSVSRAASITLNGETVDSLGSRLVSPTVTTIYELIGYGSEGVNDTSSIEILVLPAGQINRALGQEARASTIESCCGDPKVPDFAFDGDEATRWSSAWSDGTGQTAIDPNTDGDPDEEWIDVKLEHAIELNSVVLDWEVAHSSQYEIQTSLDGVNWNTVFSEMNSDGGIDSISFSPTVFTKFVRMNGLDRATEFGHSLWEFEVRGAVSVIQPPEVSIVNPVDNQEFAIGSSTEIEVEAVEDEEIEYVSFFLDGDSIGVDMNAPYSFLINDIKEGGQVVYAKSRDNDGLIVQSEPITIIGSASVISERLEAENATLSGATSVMPGVAGSSKGAVVNMDGSGSISWDDLNYPAATEITINVRYQLPFDYKEQKLSINGETVDTLIFSTPIDTWLDVSTTIQNPEPIQSISIDHYWGYMWFDYVDVTLKGIAVSNEDIFEPMSFALNQNYPNPFNPSTSISFTIPQSDLVTLKVYTILGQEVETLIEQRMTAGDHQISFNASNLSSGVYLVRLQTSQGSITRKITLIK